MFGGRVRRGRGCSSRSKLLFEPVGVLADVLVHVADGNVERAPGLASEIVPPGNVKRLLLTISQSGMTRMEPTEELRQLVHQLEPKQEMKLFIRLQVFIIFIKVCIHGSRLYLVARLSMVGMSLSVE